MKMALFIIPTIFSLIMIVSGFLSWNCPLSWESRDSHSYPHYDGKQDVTIPALLCLCLPGIAMIFIGNMITTLHLKKISK